MRKSSACVANPTQNRAGVFVITPRSRFVKSDTFNRMDEILHYIENTVPPVPADSPAAVFAE